MKWCEKLQLPPWVMADVPVPQYMGLFAGEGPPQSPREAIDRARERRGSAPIDWDRVDRMNEERKKAGQPALKISELNDIFGS